MLPFPFHETWLRGRGSSESPDIIIDAAAQLGRRIRGDGRMGFASLLELAATTPPDYRGVDGTPLLVAVLRNWPPFAHSSQSFVSLRLAPWSRVVPLGTATGVPRFPLPGEPDWDGTGEAFPAEMAAAFLIARGANPFEAAPDGATAWALAHALGAPGLVAQMARHPDCPPPGSWPWVEVQDGERIGAAHAVPPLHAALQRHPHLVSVLLSAGAPLEQTDSRGETALWATRRQESVGTTAQAVALLSAGASPWSENRQGLVLPEQVAMDHKGYCQDDLLDAWSAAALSSLETNPCSCRRARFIAAAFHLGRPDWLEALVAPPTPDEWLILEAPHGLSLLEWAWLGNALRAQYDPFRSAMETWLKQAPWPSSCGLPGAWVLASEEERHWPAGRVLEGLQAMEALVLRASWPPMEWVSNLWLTAHEPEDASQEFESGLWLVYANALARAWSSLIHEGKPWPLLDDLDALSEIVRKSLPSIPLLAPAFRALSWSLLAPASNRLPFALPQVQDGWSRDPSGRQLLGEWPRMEPHIAPAHTHALLPVLTAARLSLQLPESAPALPGSRL